MSAKKPFNYITKGLSDEALLDLVQRHTLKYFWEFGHPVSFMARERSNQNFGYDCMETVTTGGTGFGIMAMIAGAERGWIAKQDVRARIEKIVDFLDKADSYHGIFPHFLDGATGKTIPFSKFDDGADIVESSFLFAGLLAAREYFPDQKLKDKINALWRKADWNWHTKGEDVLYWHWSPNHQWKMNHKITGWNECLITYIIAASSPTHAIAKEVYDKGWAGGRAFKNGANYGGITLPLGPEKGGPLFFAHYSFMGIDPRGLKDRHADYWAQNVAHVKINHKHCAENPNGFRGYSAKCWGLTASDNHEGYNAHAPDNDHGVITPTAALSSFPYAPKEAMAALRHFYEDKGDQIWTDRGFVDAFNEGKNWVANSQLAIDQGPIVVMIENYRSGLLWKLLMSAPEIQQGLKKLGFESPHLKTAPGWNPVPPV